MGKEKLWEVLPSFARRGVVLAWLILSFGVSKGQDPVFTQFYLNKNYLNPAYAGEAGQPSIALNSRLQYTAIPGVLATNTFSVNFGGDKKTGGLGFAVLYSDHVEGEGFLHSYNLSGQMSKSVRLNTNSRKRPVILTVGLQLGIGQKSLNWDKLEFSDQFDPYQSGVRNGTFLSPQNNSSNVFMDSGLGTKLYLPVGGNKRKSYITAGASVFHINKPIQSFWGVDARLQPRYNFFVFANLGSTVKKEIDRRYFSIGMMMDIQQGLRTNTFSVFQEINKELAFGVSVRRQNFIVLDRNFDAISGHVLYTNSKYNLQLGYSYDFTISSLGVDKTFGTHEIGLTYSFGKGKADRRRKERKRWKPGDPCPQPGTVF